MMSTLRKIRTLILLTFGLTLAPVGALAQAPQEPPPEQPQEQQGPPKPAARGIPGMDDQEEQGNVDSWQPDVSPVTGLQSPTLGTPPMRHSYWVPGAQYGAMIQSNPFSGGNSGWYVTNFLAGNLSLVKQWNRSTLALNYSGGGTAVSSGAQQAGEQSGVFQQLSASQSIRFRRWLWQWADQFAYLPSSEFGFGVGTGLAQPGVGGSLEPTIGSAPLANQSIISAFGPRYSNSFVLQGTYSFTPRQSITVAGMDGILHYTQAQNVNSDEYLGSIGYNYALTKADTVGLAYSYNVFHFPGQQEAYGTSSVSVVYGRKITRTLALQLSGGPQFISYRFPLSGNTQQTSWQANATLIYAFERWNLSASYFHGLSAGGGLLIGSELNEATFSASRQLSRLWNVSGNFGFARNKALSAAESLGFESYDNYFVGASASRPFGRNVNASFAYIAYIERAGLQSCTTAFCNANYTEHTITISLSWHARPFVIE